MQYDGAAPGFRVFQTRPGPAVEITNELVDRQLWFDATSEAVLIRNGNELTAAFFESGVVFKARIYYYRREYYMNFIVQVPRSRFQNRTQGFLGNLDRDQTNEFYRRGEANSSSDSQLSDRELFAILNTCKKLSSSYRQTLQSTLLP